MMVLTQKTYVESLWLFAWDNGRIMCTLYREDGGPWHMHASLRLYVDDKLHGSDDKRVNQVYRFQGDEAAAISTRQDEPLVREHRLKLFLCFCLFPASLEQQLELFRILPRALCLLIFGLAVVEQVAIFLIDEALWHWPAMLEEELSGNLLELSLGEGQLDGFAVFGLGT